ncbi:HlyD family secretion protein [Methylosinus sp. LW4]|uniref:HlyD family secretion protein n=1 Tax=Methylosinus sp. LW4 TaxID=136993 RepID=UPI000376AF67|nr:HlyD family secretion protein [Methylosinus sp. LW4]
MIDIEPEAKTSQPKAATSVASRPQTTKIAGGLVAAATLTGVLYFWLSSQNVESTDDAFTDGHAIMIAPQVAGLVASVDVNDNQFVHKGDALIHISQRPFLIDRGSAQGALDTAKAQLEGLRLGAEIARKNFPAQLAQAQAQLANAQAVETRAFADYQRQRSLPPKATTQQEIDAAAAALKQAKAQVALAQAQVLQSEPAPQRIGEADTQVGQFEGQVETAQARLDQSNLNLSWTNVTAPQDGWVTKRNVEAGNFVAVGQQIMSLVATEVWVTANFKENQLAHMRSGQNVDIEVDAYPQLALKGHVDSIQRGAGAKFTAFPPENATGNFVKIVQRVPVKIVIDSGLDPAIPLPLGVSVTPRVYLK